MQIDDRILGSNQKFINYWTAEASYEDLKFFVFRHAVVDIPEGAFNTMIVDDSNIFNRDFTDEVSCLENYCVRSKLVKMATETCELFCKAILIEYGRCWDELKNLGHNLLDCYNALSEGDRLLIESVPIEYIMKYKEYYALMLSYPVGVGEDYKTEYPDEYLVPLTDYLQEFARGRVLPNIQARYPGERLVDFNEIFIVALAKLLYSFYKTKQVQNKEKSIYSNNGYPYTCFGKDKIEDER